MPARAHWAREIWPAYPVSTTIDSTITPVAIEM